MKPWPVTDQRQPVPVSTWCALGAVVVLLGSLAFFLMGCSLWVGLKDSVDPNFYTCEVTCTSGFGVGTEIEYIADGRVHDTPGGSFNNTVDLGSTGTITDGPASPANSGETWWKVNFPDVGVNGLEGWVFEENLLVVGGIGVTVMEKSLEVCLPPDWDLDNDDVADDCTDRVVPAFRTAHEDTLVPGTGCMGVATTDPTKEDPSCSGECTDSLGVCTTMGLDPDPPMPVPVSAAAFATTTTCAVSGTATITIDGHQPKETPTPAQGLVQLHGRPCPGGLCQLGVAVRLTTDDIEFDSGTIFASDPKVVETNLSSATEPEGIEVGPIFNCSDCSFGEIPAGALFTTVQGRRSGSSTAQWASFTNAEGLSLFVNLGADPPTCLLAGDLGGTVLDDDDTELDASAEVFLTGELVNQPPHVDTSSTTTAPECTSAEGAMVTLDGSSSSDPDDNIAFYAWRQGSLSGSLVAPPSTDPVVTTQQALGTAKTYWLRVADTDFSADNDVVDVTVVDSTPPEISCNAPATITPSDVPEKRKEGISFTATASDTCSAVGQVQITGFQCSKPKSCRVGIEGDTITIYDSGGIDDIIQWTVVANDDFANVGQKTCEISVIKKM